MKKRIYNFICCAVIATISVYANYAKWDVVVTKDSNNKECKINRKDFEEIATCSRSYFLNSRNKRVILPKNLEWGEAKKNKKSCVFKNGSNISHNKNYAMFVFAAFFEKERDNGKLYFGTKRKRCLFQQI